MVRFVWALLLVLLAGGSPGAANDEGRLGVTDHRSIQTRRVSSAEPHTHTHRAGHQHQPVGRDRKPAPRDPGVRSSQADKHGHGAGGAHDHEHKIETEHLFGFTKGSDIDPPGGKHLILDLSGRFAKEAGSYGAISQHIEYAYTPWRDFHVGLGASFSAHHVSNVPGLDDRRQLTFEGLSMDFRQRLLDRSQAPFGLTVMAEPHWARVDEVDGQRANKFAVEFAVAADKELIKDRLFAALNLIYEPEWVRLKATAELERESTIGIAMAAVASVSPSFFLGGELRYLRAYEGPALNVFAGEALFAGPVVFLNVNHQLSVIAAFSTQIAGRAAGTSNSLDLNNFERHRAKLKAVFNF